MDDFETGRLGWKLGKAMGKLIFVLLSVWKTAGP